MLLFDDVRITSIVQNLVMNAIKFSHEGGQINIDARFGNSNDELCLSVADNGVGMTTETQESLFTMFKSITRRGYGNEQSARNRPGSDRPASSNTSGIGLGLSFCKSMIVRLGGEIWFDSTRGKGSTFNIRFPVKVATNEMLVGQTVREKAMETILIGKLQRL